MGIEVTKSIRDAVRARLEAASTGFNDVMALIAPDYGVTAFTLDFSDTSRNFVEGFVTADDVDESSGYKYPLAILFTSDATDTDEERPATFVGDVQVVLDVYYDWNHGNIVRDFESIGDCIIETVVRVMNNHDTQSFGPAYWGGKIRLQKSGVQKAARGWRQQFRFVFPFKFAE